LVGDRAFLGVEDGLNQAGTIPEVYENHPPVVSPSVNPPQDRDFFPKIFFRYLKAITGALKLFERIQFLHGDSLFPGASGVGVLWGSGWEISHE